MNIKEIVDQANKEKSLCMWLERRLEWISDKGSLNVYVNIFKKMWYEQFGTSDNMPDLIKNKVNEKRKEFNLKKITNFEVK